MKPPPFEYFAPDTLDEALTLFNEHGAEAKALAGGQSLIPTMNFRLAGPAILIDLNRIKSLDYVRETNGKVEIGAMTRQRTVERSDLIKARVPLLFETMPHVAHPQIRNRGTIGGSIAHADPAAEVPVIALALDATLTISRNGGERNIKAEDFFFGLFAVDIEPDELLTRITFPSSKPRTGYAFTELARRHGDYAMMGVAVVMELDDSGQCAALKLVYLNAGDKPTATPEAASMLVGEGPSEALFAQVAAHASQDEIMPFGNIHASEDYQRHLARVLTERALKTAYQRAQSA